MHYSENSHKKLPMKFPHVQPPLGPDESHTIHKLRATTVIFEEGSSSFDEEDGPVIANIVLPNKPHSSAVQVEEMGSFKLETESIYTIGCSSDSHTIHGIIDEIDSDGDLNNVSYRRTMSRNVSIVSASEDESSIGSGMMTSSRDVSVDEFNRDVQFEDGHAHIKFIKTVIEEQEIVTENDDDDDDERPNRVAQVNSSNVEGSIKMNTTKLDEKSVNELPKATKANMLIKEEAEEVKLQLTEGERKQLRIKEVRANARKASLVWKAEIIEKDGEIDTLLSSANEIDIGHSPIKAKLFENESADDGHIESSSKAIVNDVEPLNVTLSEMLIDDDNEDEDVEMAALLKRVRAQRSALCDILNKDQPTNTADQLELDSLTPGRYTTYIHILPTYILYNTVRLVINTRLIFSLALFCQHTCARFLNIHDFVAIVKCFLYYTSFLYILCIQLKFYLIL